MSLNVVTIQCIGCMELDYRVKFGVGQKAKIYCSQIKLIYSSQHLIDSTYQNQATLKKANIGSGIFFYSIQRTKNI